MEAVKNMLSLLKGDKYIWGLVIFFSVMSLFIVYSSTSSLAYSKFGGNTELHLIKQISFMFLGYVALLVTYFLNYMKYSKLAPIFLIVSIVLLLFTITNGVRINDATRWLRIPFIGMTFQTSDLAKISLILFVAREISRHQEKIKSLRVFLSLIFPILLVCGLILPSDLSTAAMLFAICCVMMFVGRINAKYIYGLLIIALFLFAIMIFAGMLMPDVIRVDTWIARINDFVTNTEGVHQVREAKIAISNGKLFGVGPGNSFQKYYIPHPYSDLVFAFIIEEYGLILGTLMTAGAFMFLLWRSIGLITLSPLTFGSMIVLGMTLLLVFQALINMAVAVHLVPVTGMAMPFYSLGGTSTILSFVSIGIILCVSKYIVKEQ